MLMLDNAKAFDRLQHQFALDVLHAFNLPPSLINAVKTLYNGAETRAKITGHLAPPFPNTSGVKQGCPLSGLLYILVQEVQLRMIREDVGIRGIPIPGPVTPTANSPPPRQPHSPRAAAARPEGKRPSGRHYSPGAKRWSHCFASPAEAQSLL